MSPDYITEALDVLDRSFAHKAVDRRATSYFMIVKGYSPR